MSTATLFPTSVAECRRLVTLDRRIRADWQNVSLASTQLGTGDYALARTLEAAGRVKLVCYSRRKGVAFYRAIPLERGAR